MISFLLIISWPDKVDRVLSACQSAFGDPVIYSPAGGSPVPFAMTGIFDDNHQTVDPGTMTEVTSEHPILGVKVIDIVTGAGRKPVSGDTVNVKGRDFKIVDFQQTIDGQDATLVLHETG